MAVLQIDAANCTIMVTLCLWLWTRLKLPEGCCYHEAGLKRQNVASSWAFALLVGLQIVGLMTLEREGAQTLIAVGSSLIFYFFAAAAYSQENGFWSKRRNHGISLVLILAVGLGFSALIAVANFLPVLCALAISHLCRKRYIHIVVSSIKDLEAIQAKLLKQEAAFANARNFDNFRIQKSS